MRIKKLSILATIILAITMIGTSVYAELKLVEQNTQTDGATTITWDSSFEDLDYTIEDTIVLTVHWRVDAGAAEYHSFSPSGPKFTPKGPDPADGTAPRVTDVTAGTITATGSGWVEVEFEFTDLHWSEEDNADIGNAHFKLYLGIDTNGDDEVDTLAGYGVNVHVEDPQD